MGFGRSAISLQGFATAGANVGLAVLNLAFAWAHVLAYSRQPRLSVALLVFLEVLIASLFVARRDAEKTSYRAAPFLVTVFGIYLPLLLRPVPGALDGVLATAFQVGGSIAAVLAAASLNRSFGLLPAYRGVKDSGAYRIVRHPLYASYLLMHLGYVLNNPSAWNVAVLAAAIPFQLARVVYEEQLLARYPSYRNYRARTRWRLVPFVF
jgi:protein-S-isoprenylcysteine O-methyltransferase Ste14